MGRRFGWTLSLVLCISFVSGEAWGQGERQSEELRLFLQELRREEAPAPRVRKPQGLEKSVTCTADCGGGQSVSVTCPGICSAQDRDCTPIQEGEVVQSAGPRGAAWCDGGTPVYCPEPCYCSAETHCPGGGSVWCTGTDQCIGGDGICFVNCDGNEQFCPGYFGQILC